MTDTSENTASEPILLVVSSVAAHGSMLARSVICTIIDRGLDDVHTVDHVVSAASNLSYSKSHCTRGGSGVGHALRASDARITSGSSWGSAGGGASMRYTVADMQFKMAATENEAFSRASSSICMPSSDTPAS